MATQETPEPASLSPAEIKAFDSFPWSKHMVFLLGLVETLGGQPALYPNPTHEGTAAFCRTVFFTRQTGRRVDLTQYNLYRGENPDYPSIDRRLLVALYTAAKEVDLETATASLSLLSQKQQPQKESSSLKIARAVAAKPLINPFDGTPTPPIRDNVPSWQRRAPKSSLQVDRNTVDTASASADGEAPYSDKFAKIVEAIQSGKELEGIKQIPDTVLRQPGIVPVGKLKAPRKPWERDDAVQNSSILSFLASTDKADGADSTGNNPYQTVAPLGGVDLEFPPPEPENVEGEVGGEVEAGAETGEEAEAKAGQPPDETENQKTDANEPDEVDKLLDTQIAR